MLRNALRCYKKINFKCHVSISIMWLDSFFHQALDQVVDVAMSIALKYYVLPSERQTQYCKLTIATVRSY